MNFETEPTLGDIDDYQNNESTKKRRTVKLIIIGLVVAGLVYSFIAVSSKMPSDYIGTDKNPGIGIKIR